MENELNEAASAILRCAGQSRWLSGWTFSLVSSCVSLIKSSELNISSGARHRSLPSRLVSLFHKWTWSSKPWHGALRLTEKGTNNSLAPHSSLRDLKKKVGNGSPDDNQDKIQSGKRAITMSQETRRQVKKWRGECTQRGSDKQREPGQWVAS